MDIVDRLLLAAKQAVWPAPQYEDDTLYSIAAHEILKLRKEMIAVRTHALELVNEAQHKEWKRRNLNETPNVDVTGQRLRGSGGQQGSASSEG